MSSIQFFLEDIAYPIAQKRKLKQWMLDTIHAENHALGDINIILCSDAYLLTLNTTYLQHDTFTDIITFDYSTPEYVSGELYISLERVKENAALFGVNIQDELKRIMIHGILHLLGYKDKTAKDKKRMTAKEEAYLGAYQKRDNSHQKN